MKTTGKFEQTFTLISLTLSQRNKDGIMQYPEFKELLQCLICWQQMFRTCADRDGSGYVEANELLNVIMTKFGKSVKNQYCRDPRS